MFSVTKEHRGIFMVAAVRVQIYRLFTEAEVNKWHQFFFFFSQVQILQCIHVGHQQQQKVSLKSRSFKKKWDR